MGEQARPKGRLDRTASEPRTIDQAVAAAGAEVDPLKRADLLDQIAARAEALDAAIKETDGLATGLTRDRQAIGERVRHPDRLAQPALLSRDTALPLMPDPPRQSVIR